MKLADFSAQEQACHAKRIVLHRLWKKVKDDKSDYITPPAGKVVADFLQELPLLPVTGECSKEVEVVIKELLMVKIPCIHLPIKASQVIRTESLKKRWNTIKCSKVQL